MLIEPASLQQIHTDLHLGFLRGIEVASPTWQNFAMEVTSTSTTNLYAYLSKLPGMKKWVGERQLNNMAARAYQLENEKYEDSITVRREDIEDDQLSLASTTAQALGEAAMLWPDDIVIAALKAGSTEECYDGQYFFDTDHPIDPEGVYPGTQSNSHSSLALNATNFGILRKRMAEQQGSNGRRLRVNGDLLVVPPALTDTANLIVSAQYISVGSGSTQDNIQRNNARVLTVPDLAGADTTWYLIDSSKPVKPFIFQNRIPPEFQAITDLNHESVVKRDEFFWGVRSRGAAGYGMYQLAHKAVA